MPNLRSVEERLWFHENVTDVSSEREEQASSSSLCLFQRDSSGDSRYICPETVETISCQLSRTTKCACLTEMPLLLKYITFSKYEAALTDSKLQYFLEHYHFYRSENSSKNKNS